MRRVGWITVFFLTGFLLSSQESRAVPSPYFGYSDEAVSSDSAQNGGLENLQTVMLGGEWIGSRKGTGLQRLGLLSWQKDFISNTPTLTYLNASAASDGGRLTLEFPGAVDPYVVLIADYPYFYQSPEVADPLAVTRFRGRGMGMGILKRTRTANIRLGAERVFGKLDGEVKESGWKMIEFVQLERDRTRRTKLDEPVEGTRLFASLSTGQFRGFSAESEKTVVTVQGTEEWYHPLTKMITFGVVAREGAESRTARFWTTTVGSLQEDDFNVPLPGYLYQQFEAKDYIEGEAGLGFRPRPDWSLHLGYDVAGGWSPHVYSSISVGVTHLLLHKLPLTLQGAWGFSPSGAAEILVGTVFQW